MSGPLPVRRRARTGGASFDAPTPCGLVNFQTPLLLGRTSNNNHHCGKKNKIHSFPQTLLVPRRETKDIHLNNRCCLKRHPEQPNISDHQRCSQHRFLRPLRRLSAVTRSGAETVTRFLRPLRRLSAIPPTAAETDRLTAAETERLDLMPHCPTQLFQTEKSFGGGFRQNCNTSPFTRIQGKPGSSNALPTPG